MIVNKERLKKRVREWAFWHNAHFHSSPVAAEENKAASQAICDLIDKVPETGEGEGELPRMIRELGEKFDCSLEELERRYSGVHPCVYGKPKKEKKPPYTTDEIVKIWKTSLIPKINAGIDKDGPRSIVELAEVMRTVCREAHDKVYYFAKRTGCLAPDKKDEVRLSDEFTVVKVAEFFEWLNRRLHSVHVSERSPSKQLKADTTRMMAFAEICQWAVARLALLEKQGGVDQNHEEHLRAFMEFQDSLREKE